MPLPLSKNQKVIHLLANVCGRKLGRTRLTKALFLADYQSRRLVGRPITTYEYKYHHHGPWTGQIQEDVEALEAIGAVAEHGYAWLKGVGHYYTVESEADYTDLTPTEIFLLEAVADRCASGDLDELLKEVYGTPPMRKAQSIGKGVRIPMEQIDREPRTGRYVDLQQLEQSERELDAGLGEDFDAVVNALQTAHLPNR